MTLEINTAWKVSKYGVFSGPYFPVFWPEKTPYLEAFHAVKTIGSRVTNYTEEH